MSGANWRDDAACKGKGELFFAKDSERPEARSRREAQASQLCEGCGVLDQCREAAQENLEWGFWGGESTEVRARNGFAPTVSGWPGCRGVVVGLPRRSSARRNWVGVALEPPARFGDGPVIDERYLGSGRASKFSWWSDDGTRPHPRAAS